jgi:Glycoside hydrolase 123, N-terminal domain
MLPLPTRLVRRAAPVAWLLAALLPHGARGQQPLRYGTGAWERDSLGNHRAVLHVDAGADAVFAHVEWRRRDPAPEKVQLVLMDARTQLRVHNVARMQVTREAGDIVFQPPTAPGDYYLYYLPYTGTFRSNYPKITWRTPDDTPDRSWLLRNALTPENARFGGYRQLPAAHLVGFDAVDDFSAFTPMEYIASAAELGALRTRYAWAEYLAFAEDRSLSIRMAGDIPQRWAQRGPFQPFFGTVQRGEYYTLQVGVYAHRAPLDSVHLAFTEFTRKGGGGTIPARAVSCINQEGVDWAGHRFTRAVHVDRGRVQAMWVGIDVPAGTPAGEYEGDITVHTAGTRERPIRVVLRVEDATITNHGDDDPARLTRLRWLDSQLAADDRITPPYVPMQVEGTTIRVLGRALTFGPDGLPVSIRSFFAPDVTRLQPTGREVLAAPIRLDVRGDSGAPVEWSGGPAVVTHRAEGAVTWEGTRRAGRLVLRTAARMEFEGTTEYTVALLATRRTRLRDVRLEIPMRPEAARYMMGLGVKGGTRPPAVHWVWDVAKKNQDGAWIGDVNAGLQFTLRDEHYVRPLNTNFYLSKPLVLPTSWGNGGVGGCNIGDPAATGSRTPAGAVVVSCYSGERVLEAGDSLRFDFRLMITPFKTLDTAGQWSTRYFHAFVPIDSIATRGANTVNVHHATRVNPWINYPFLEPAQMKAYIDSAHARRMKVKIYYTVRELTDHAPELFALRSLGDEVLSHGPGGGSAWLQEHLGDDYISAWHVPEIRDAAVVNSGVSRWHNFYVEGLDWLVQHVGIDGLYIDDVAFDRITMERVRKVLDRGRPGALIDLHSANQYNPRDGYASSANLYLEHFPFLNRLWFGEYFDYDSPPDYWLVELSGIPFGLMGEMLEKGGNPWRGMTFGMTNRMPWSGDPSPLWKAWDDFGIAKSRMVGWWSGASPVRSGRDDVLATTWLAPGKALVSLGSWAPSDTVVHLAIDWKALGLDPARTRVHLPAIEGFQEARTFAPTDPIPVPAGKGLLLVLSP